MSELRKYLYLSQIALFAGLIICLVITPSVATREGGVSNFGNHWSTVGFYSLGFLMNVGYIYLAAKSVLALDSRLVYVTPGLKFLSLFTLIVFISTFPRHFSFTYSDIHDYSGVALYSYYFFISVWILIKKPTAVLFTFLAIQATGSIIGLLSTLKVVDCLFIGQLIGALGFGLLLCVGLPTVLEEKSHIDGVKA